MKKILIVEDNEGIIKGLLYLLQQEKFEVGFCKDVNTAKKKIENNIYDIVILDITLPDGNGFELCKYIKEINNIPVIFLTAKDEEKDVVLGFDIGADDYIIKPFRNKELISRINNVLRRYNNDKNKIECNNIVINLDSMRVYIKEEEVVFTALEYKILVLLFSNINKTVTREQILEKIWDIAGNFVNDNTLTVYIKRIREKLGENDNIRTIKGIGYRVEDNENNE